ncbi:FAD-binding domain-containing protein [Pseudooctadecabacter jejudonensis]|uniref:Cryptochrome-like protein cry2 n=1 Tax=Pseudooctadecabacter jejudonensis TaxID=1391910 RepID=A0A1Y5RPE6_9RHOB|nr:FAD-binding domain-containing protein [Pseudooctadecabacter jejudonensis]SLN19554.1 Cryptochrome-like protein cry2 [Pseudooctadecabacter jejudonensis]
MIIVWFKRDLRVQDHAPLAAAAALGPVIPLYIYEPDYWALPDTSGRQWAFIRDCLDGLAKDLAHLGAPLVVRRGDAVQVLEDLRRTFGVTTLLAHEETGNGWTFARDRRVQDWARGQGVRFREAPNSGVARRLRSRDGWAKQRDGRIFAEQVNAPKALSGPAVPSDPLPEGPFDPIKDRQKGGRDQGLSLLGGFLTERGHTYRAAMSSPLEGATACSRLSPHIAAGTLSIREIAQATAARQREDIDSQWKKSLKSFQSRLAWRDHFMQKLEDQPRIETHCLHSAYENMRGDHPVRRAAWEKGETGLPFVDACMRSLNATGWLNFRMRSMVQAVASYHLWLDWRASAPHLARMFTDYEPGIHWSQAQMQSGTTGMNTVRIYNPVKQGKDQDPTGVFTRRWLPELATVPDAYVQEPWLWDGAPTLAYPPPLIDVMEAAREARARIWAVRTGEDFRGEAADIIRKHASRKDGKGRFVNDRTPRKRKPRKGVAKPDTTQLSFDL